MAAPEQSAGPASLFESSTFQKDVSIKVDDAGIGAASISPSGRDVVLASKTGLFILDLDSPYSPPRHILHRTDWDVADVQWSPFASRADRIATTANQKAIIFNLGMSTTAHKAPVEFTLHSHDRAITDINFSAHNPDLLATCAVDSFVLTWDLRTPWSPTNRMGLKPSYQVADFEAGATQVKWNRKNEFIMASSHDKFLRVWDTRKGAVPITEIAAHRTKIYGIDWHRSDASKILTCSLDKTIKIWDQVGISHHVLQPTRVIRTDHPVWRARHTPFLNGILAMPQRGSSALNLYTYSAGTTTGNQKVTAPAHSFHAHEDDARVQEFLWRSRGSVDDGIDNREFQLVSWGTDRHLHLYTVSSELLSKTVGFRKGAPVIGEPSTTRRGAPYVSYRDDPPKIASKSRSGLPSTGSQQGTLSSLLQSAPRPSTLPSVSMSTSEQRATMTAGTIRHSAFGRIMSNIKWMDGVKVGERRIDTRNKDQTSATSDDQYRWTIREDLAAEVSHVGNTYTKVTFEEVEIPERRITVAFQGPWGEIDNATDRKGERRLAFLRLTINFPDDYPHLTTSEDENDSVETTQMPNPLQIEFHRTTAAIEDTTLAKLKEDLNRIAKHRAALGREALEPIICYALGERELEDSLVAPGELRQGRQTPEPDVLLEEESSSDDDDDEESGLSISQDIMNSSLSNANMPLPVHCSIRWSPPGELILVRLPPADPSPASLAELVRLPRHLTQTATRDEIFHSFGRLNIPHEYDSQSPTSSDGSWEWSSSPSSSSGSDDEIDVPQSRFQPPIAWQNPALRLQSKTSHPSSVGVTKADKSKSIVSILASSAEELIPSKRCLAEQYRIFGDGPQVCAHNAAVARRFGFEDLADIWELCKLILNNEVPLEILAQQHRREQVLVLARRALVRIKRKDSGLDLQFDEADNVTNPKLRGRIKWGNHAVVTWLIPALFEHFEKLADTQMLAMLSCVFCEPAAREGVTSAMARMRQSNLPMSMEAPAFSLDYFSSAEAAWSLFKPTISIPSTPAHSRYATPVNEFSWHRLTKPLDTYGSHGSSNGPWGSDTVPSEPVTPYSTGNTPPNLSRAPTLRSTTSHTPFSTSPEQSHVSKKTSTGNFASAFASLSRPFTNTLSSSPPIKGRNEADLSTSAPTSGVTWGTTTFYSSGSNERSLGPSRTKHGKRASFGQADRINIDYYSDSDSEYGDTGLTHDGASEYTAPLTLGTDDEGGNIRVTLKNQNLFDDEACVSAPLLDMGKEWLYRAWREQYAEMLGCWGLVSKRAEVLKFNGLISYFPFQDSRSSSKAGSMHLALKAEGGEISLPASQPLSRTSTLAPPPTFPTFRRSPAQSPRHFSFNPEATEFRPGASFDSSSDIPAPPPDVFVSSEQYLRLSIPTATKEYDDLNPIAFDGAADSKLLKPQTELSRNASRTSSMGQGKDKKGPIYSCSICWIRVSGRFFLCPSCGHVAHFDCMCLDTDRIDEGLGLGMAWEEGECVVGCGCGCGFEDEEQRDHGWREAWDERGGWLPIEHEDAVNGIEEYRSEGGYGDGLGKWRSPEKESKGFGYERRGTLKRSSSAYR